MDRPPKQDRESPASTVDEPAWRDLIADPSAYGERLGEKMLPMKHQIPRYLRFKMKTHARMGKFLHIHPRIQKAAIRCKAFFHSILDDCQRYGTKLDFEQSLRHSDDISAHGYTDRFGDIHSAIGYGTEIHGPGFGPNSVGESYHFYEMEKTILRKLFEDDPEIDVFLNFGVSYAYIDSIIARENKKTSFFGLDLAYPVNTLTHNM